jgi:hypothetical protein
LTISRIASEQVCQPLALELLGKRDDLLGGDGVLAELAHHAGRHVFPPEPCVGVHQRPPVTSSNAMVV